MMVVVKMQEKLWKSFPQFLSVGLELGEDFFNRAEETRARFGAGGFFVGFFGLFAYWDLILGVFRGE